MENKNFEDFKLCEYDNRDARVLLTTFPLHMQLFLLTVGLISRYRGTALNRINFRNRLQSLGCFSDVDIHVDTSKEGGHSDYEVTFSVKELKRMIGSVNTMVGNQEGCVMVGGQVCNNI